MSESGFHLRNWVTNLGARQPKSGVQKHENLGPIFQHFLDLTLDDFRMEEKKCVKTIGSLTAAVNLSFGLLIETD